MHGTMSPSTDCIAALATPVGTSAIAVVRASGPQVPELLRAIFGNTALPRTAQHADYRDSRGALVDDVLFTWFAAPNSYTGQDTLEISCHGNPYIAQRILEDLLARGCRSADPGEFTQRAFLNGRMDLSQAEAVMDLIHARSERALLAANQQLRGSLGRKMEELSTLLIGILAQIEALHPLPQSTRPRHIIGASDRAGAEIGGNSSWPTLCPGSCVSTWCRLPTARAERTGRPSSCPTSRRRKNPRPN